MRNKCCAPFSKSVKTMKFSLKQRNPPSLFPTSGVISQLLAQSLFFKLDGLLTRQTNPSHQRSMSLTLLCWKKKYNFIKSVFIVYVILHLSGNYFEWYYFEKCYIHRYSFYLSTNMCFGVCKKYSAFPSKTRMSIIILCGDSSISISQRFWIKGDLNIFTVLLHAAVCWRYFAFYN